MDCLKSDVKKIENVQRRATKLIKSVKNLPYEVRLKKLDMLSLENRRVRGDLIQTFKLLNQLEEVSLINGINSANERVGSLRRPHDRRLVREINKKGTHRYNFLTNRVVNAWNNRSREAVNAKSVNSFKAIIDREVFGMADFNGCQDSSESNALMR